MKIITTIILSTLLILVGNCTTTTTQYYASFTPFSGVNCTGSISGQGSSYLLNTCLPYGDKYSIKYVPNNDNTAFTPIYYLYNADCSRFPTKDTTLNIGQCYSNEINDPDNGLFYSSASIQSEPLAPPSSGQPSLYSRFFDKSDQSCSETMLWSQFYTNNTAYDVNFTQRETFYCDPITNNPMQQICNLGGNKECTTNDLSSKCQYDNTYLANSIYTCVDGTTSDDIIKVRHIK
ncbi:hypothetical protein DFA_09934 [Cavenderia fasciculata]|uniref:Lipoprotein n=1 Tax=Cavenderia fasciculata TaxID=261658 RepID=F4Q8U1_CACFS|nr:uncharacterized protein DFA_09934 [Cavenderia fasciculata]EGG15110.1 hypothetical protein DFA_09934 [Cavenderia fasciculata]|eukprot:XP_004351830.1 hypothetical protein DFA_09934 [Cavenderia fasciculata]